MRLIWPPPAPGAVCLKVDHVLEGPNVMWSSNPKSPLDRFVESCISIAAGVMALYVAVRLIEAIWVPLLTIVLVVGVLAAAGLALRARYRGW
jgi:hypothetical protein